MFSRVDGQQKRLIIAAQHAHVFKHGVLRLCFYGSVPNYRAFSSPQLLLVIWANTDIFTAARDFIIFSRFRDIFESLTLSLSRGSLVQRLEHVTNTARIS